MKAGFGKVCINPPHGFPIAGYFEKRFVKGVHDDLFARAIAFDDGENRAVIVALDTCHLMQPSFDLLKKRISEACGIAQEAIFINCSHTHTGPVVDSYLTSDDESAKRHIEFLANAVSVAVVSAFGDLAKASIESAKTEAKRVSFIRRYRMKDGSVRTNPGVNNPDIDHALGTPNEEVKLIKIKRENADDIAIVNFGTHPDSVGGEYISADYPGYVCSIIERAVPGTKCMFLQGCEGDVNHVNVAPTKAEAAISRIDFDSVPRSNELSEYMGRIIAGAVLSVYSVTEKIKSDKISFAFDKISLPSYQENDRIPEVTKTYELYMAGRANELPFKEMELTTALAEAKRIMTLKDGPLAFDYFLSAIKIGDLVFAGIGGEVFTDIGRRILSASPFAETVLCCLTNSAGGYVPTGVAYTEGGYEAKSSKLKPGADDIMVEGMTKLLEKLKG